MVPRKLASALGMQRKGAVRRSTQPGQRAILASSTMSFQIPHFTTASHLMQDPAPTCWPPLPASSWLRARAWPQSTRTARPASTHRPDPSQPGRGCRTACPPAAAAFLPSLRHLRLTGAGGADASCIQQVHVLRDDVCKCHAGSGEGLCACVRACVCARAYVCERMRDMGARMRRWWWWGGKGWRAVVLLSALAPREATACSAACGCARQATNRRKNPFGGQGSGGGLRV